MTREDKLFKNATQIAETGIRAARKQQAETAKALIKQGIAFFRTWVGGLSVPTPGNLKRDV